MICQYLVSCQNEAAPGRKKCQWHLDEVARYGREWREKNADRLNERMRELYAEAAKDGLGVWTRGQTRYGLKREDYLRMLEERDRLCDICKQPETSKGNHGRVKNLSIDHDHDTGRVRGLLCNNCNRALGLLKDSEETLLAAVAYLRATSGVLS